MLGEITTTIKVQAVVYRDSIPWGIQDDLNIQLFNDSDADVILFPGWSFRDTNHVENFKSSISNNKTLGFLELQRVDSRDLTNALFSISKGELKFVSIQLFSTSNEIATNPVLGQMFVDQFANARAFKVKNKIVRIMQCGELNILRNEQANGNKVEFRFLDKSLEIQFLKSLQETALILNPQHTPMGNQGKMSRRRAYLSSNRRGYISTSNVSTGQELEKTKSAHYAYFNGRELERNTVDKGEFHRVYEYDLNCG